MNFLPRDICEKLVEKGCKSESGLWYLSTLPGVHYIWLDEDKYHPICQAFIFQDFCGISEQARKNSKILFGEKLICYDCGQDIQKPLIVDFIQIGTGTCDCSRQFENNFTNSEFQREQMLWMRWDEWVEFMRNATKETEK